MISTKAAVLLVLIMRTHMIRTNLNVVGSADSDRCRTAR